MPDMSTDKPRDEDFPLLHGPAYPKVQNLWAREDNLRIPGKFQDPIFALPKSWVVTEKLDGMNMRVTCHPDGNFAVCGRTEKANIPADLMMWIQKHIQPAAVFEALEILGIDPGEQFVTLYGEGMGGKIQSGTARYGEEKHFTLFDVRIGTRVGGWLDDAVVGDVSKHLAIPRAEVLAWDATIGQVSNLVAGGFHTFHAPEDAECGKHLLAEGVMCRTLIPLYDRRGKRVMFKLKYADLQEFFAAQAEKDGGAWTA